MSKKILITGATDGIGLATAKRLVSLGHYVLLHGRNPVKLKKVVNELNQLSRKHQASYIESYIADLSNIKDVLALSKAVTEQHKSLDVLINNAGVFKTAQTIMPNGFDSRFIVNTIAPYLLTQQLMPLMTTSGRVINLSSAAQTPVDLHALLGKYHLKDDFNAYAQSKLAITMWSRHLALKENTPMIVAINPGSLLATKMVKEGFNVAGNDISIGADILVRAALSDEFAEANGLYFDNDSRQFALPHPDALNEQKSADVVNAIEMILARLT